MTSKEVLKFAKEKGARIVDLRFIDLPGLWQHFSIPISELTEEVFEEGLGFDGSSIRGFQTIDQSYNSGYYFIDSEAGFWNAGKEGTEDRPNLGYKPRYKQGYFPVPPMDKFQDIRSDMVLALESVGVRIEVHHHEVATGGQTEVDMRYDTLTKMADKVLWYKYCAKNTARNWGKTTTFMPKPLEFRTPDPTCNPYLSFSACLMAGLDGIANKIDPGKPVDKDLYELPPAEQKKIKQLPGDLSIVLDNLEKSHDWLLKGDVFTPDVIETWIEYKRKNEVDAVRLRPHPWEFALYFDI